MNNLKANYSFWQYKSKQNSKGESPIYMRILVGKDKVELTTGISVKQAHWLHKSQKVASKDLSYQMHNAKIEAFKRSFDSVYTSIIKSEIEFDAQYIRDKIDGRGIECKTLIEVFRNHNKMMKGLIGKEFAKATATRYDTMLIHIQRFLKYQYKRDDILLSHLNVSFLHDLEYYFKTVRNTNHNTAAKYIKNLKKVINYALLHEWIEKNPFNAYKIKIKPTQLEFLTPDEIEAIVNKDFGLERLNKIKWIFLFQCFTGLAYVDVKGLTNTSMIELNGSKWIYIERCKTKQPVRIPLLNKALDILNQFKVDDGTPIFPVPTNQKMNAYLKEIATICKIDKTLSTHTARRTFATSITLLKGVSIESISSMLGHSSIRTTQIYSKVIPTKIWNEMDKLN